jgi:predicted transposase/invertase (TIGR01784 family)
LIFVELPKFEATLESLLKKVKTDGVLTGVDRLGVWSGYFSNADMGVEIVQTMAARDPIFQELRRTEEDYWQRPEARYYLLRERLGEMDKMAEIDDARAEAKAEGKAEGRAEGRAGGITEGIEEAAKRMLRKGKAPEIVAEDVDLPLGVVRSLHW